MESKSYTRLCFQFFREQFYMPIFWYHSWRYNQVFHYIYSSERGSTVFPFTNGITLVMLSLVGSLYILNCPSTVLYSIWTAVEISYPMVYNYL